MGIRKLYVDEAERKEARAAATRRWRAQMTDEKRSAQRDATTAATRARRAQMTDEERFTVRDADAAAKRTRVAEMNEQERNDLQRRNAEAQGETRRRRAQTRARETACVGLIQYEEINEIDVPQHYCGAFDQICNHCQSFNFVDERRQDGEYNFCHKGRIRLKMQRYPYKFRSLLRNLDPKSKNFLENIRKFNSALAFASMGAQISLPPGHGPYCFRIHGQVYHNSGALHPIEGQTRKFAQIYILDPVKQPINEWPWLPTVAAIKTLCFISAHS